MIPIDKITIICPTYERHKQLKRSWEFYSKTNIKVIYFDGSKKKLEPFDNPNNNIKYLHDRKSYLERLKVMIDLVKTPYICLMDDEDIFLPESIFECIKYLEENKDYVSCIGEFLDISKVFNSIKLDVPNNSFHNNDLSEEDFRKRLKKHFNSYFTRCFYSVIRTEVFKNIYKNIYDFETDCYALSELIVEFLIITYGKCKILPNLYCLRGDDGEKNINNGKTPSNPNDVNKIKLSFPNWWKSNEKIHGRQKREIINFIKNNSKNQIDDKTIINTFNICLGNAYFKNSFIGKFNFILKFIFRFRKKNEYKKLYFFLRSIYLRLYSLKNIYLYFKLKKSNQKILNNLHKKGLIFDENIIDIFE